MFAVAGSERPVLALGMLYPTSDYAVHDRSVEAVFDPDGRAIFAVAYEFSQKSTAVGALSVTPSGLTQALYSSKTTTQRYRMANWSSPNSFKDADRPLSSIGPGSIGGIQANGPMVLQTLWDPYTQYAVVSTQPAAPIAPTLDAVRPLANGFVGRSLGGRSILVVDSNGTSHEAHSAVPGRTISGVASIQTGTNSVVWVESAGTAPTLHDSVLYTAPLSNPTTKLVPRLVGSLPGTGGLGGSLMVAMNGMAVVVPDYDHVLLLRLSDGATWTLRAQPGEQFTQPLWADDTEVWIGAGSTHGTGIYENKTLRVPRDVFSKIN
ncbi:MAG: hypothetical protein HOO96_36175 [Polyangiaceae bacterium]|nr:hypothetical protein [Polyangiaceae bacterium]